MDDLIKIVKDRQNQSKYGVKPFSKVVICGSKKWENAAPDSFELDKLVCNVVYSDSSVSIFILLLHILSDILC